jgi:hypothetical protein
MALPLYVSLEQIDERLLEAAKDLYASPMYTQGLWDPRGSQADASKLASA